MRIQETTIHSQNCVKRESGIKPVKTEDKKTAEVKDKSEEEEKLELARAKERELEIFLEEQKKRAEEAKEQAEAEKMKARHFTAILEIFRRIARGDKVPPKDEAALMEYDMKLYKAAKSAAELDTRKKYKKYKKSLIEELEEMAKEKQEEKAKEAQNAGNSSEAKDGGEPSGEKKAESGETLGTSVDVSV